MKYEKEIEQLFIDLFYEECLDQDDFNDVLNEALKLNNISKQSISEQLEIGVNNGYTVEDQIMLVKLFFMSFKNEK